MKKRELIRKSIINAIWAALLTLPIAVIKVDTVEKNITWRWYMVPIVTGAIFLVSILWIRQTYRQEMGITFNLKVSFVGKLLEKIRQKFMGTTLGKRYHKLSQTKHFHLTPTISLLVATMIFPFIAGSYTTSIFTTALIYIILGLGLNICVGFGGLLNLGYAAFYGIGAYTYGLLYFYFGIGFWVSLPLAAIISGVFGLLLGLPVLRLKGDYLAIVTLGFGEMVRIVLENFGQFTQGPSGIANIPKPSLFGHTFGFFGSTRYVYFIALFAVLLVIFIVKRLNNSRVGRSWVAMRENEIASEAMGIDLTKTKLALFVISSMVAGIAGAVFAAKNSFIDPASFKVMVSVTVLCVVVLGGKGSIKGPIIGALIFMLLPEYLRFLSEYRMLMFGFLLVIMMVFRPGGIIKNVRKTYKIKGDE